MAEEQNSFTFVDRRKGSETHDTTSGQPPEIAAQTSTDPAATQENLDSAVADGESGAAESEASESSEDGAEFDIYALASYSLQLFVTAAWQSLGLWADPKTGQVRADLEQARIAIDIVGDLVARLDGAPDMKLQEKDKRELKRILNDLRMNYVARQNQS